MYMNGRLSNIRSQHILLEYDTNSWKKILYKLPYLSITNVKYERSQPKNQSYFPAVTDIVEHPWYLRIDNL